MISPVDLMKRLNVDRRLVPFFKCVCVYWAVGGLEPGAGAVAVKCAPVLCLLFAVLVHAASLPYEQGRYARLVGGGLALSALGDALLVWPARLAGGMAAFGAAHVLYLRAFSRHAPPRWALGALLAGGAALYCARVVPRDAWLAALLPPYAALLGGSAWRGAARGGAAGLGALLFLVSDAVLGCALFAGPVPHARLIVMSTYYLAQLAIAVSALRT